MQSKHHSTVAAILLATFLALLISRPAVASENWTQADHSPVTSFSAARQWQLNENSHKAPSLRAFSRNFLPHQVWKDFQHLAGTPDFYLVIGGIAAAPVAFRKAFRNEEPEITEMWGNSPFADNFFESGEVIGAGVFPVSASVLLWAAGKGFHSDPLRDFGSDLLEAQAINGILTLALKATINRTRPNGGPYSYPSGHTSTAFTTAGVVYTHLGKTWGIPAFFLAGYVGLSRLQEGKHYLSDVIAGGILGSYVSLKLGHHNDTPGPVSVTPRRISTGYGLSLSLRF